MNKFMLTDFLDACDGEYFKLTVLESLTCNVLYTFDFGSDDFNYEEEYENLNYEVDLIRFPDINSVYVYVRNEE